MPRDLLSYLSAIHVHLQSQGQKLPPSGMTVTQTVEGTDNRSWGKSPHTPGNSSTGSRDPEHVPLGYSVMNRTVFAMSNLHIKLEVFTCSKERRPKILKWVTWPWSRPFGGNLSCLMCHSPGSIRLPNLSAKDDCSQNQSRDADLAGLMKGVNLSSKFEAPIVTRSRVRKGDAKI